MKYFCAWWKRVRIFSHMSLNIFTHICTWSHRKISCTILSKRVIPLGIVIEVDIRIKSLVHNEKSLHGLSLLWSDSGRTTSCSSPWRMCSLLWSTCLLKLWMLGNESLGTTSGCQDGQHASVHLVSTTRIMHSSNKLDGLDGRKQMAKQMAKVSVEAKNGPSTHAF